MTESKPKKKRIWLKILLAIVGLWLLFVLVSGVVFGFTYDQSEKRSCIKDLKSKLDAPSTLKVIRYNKGGKEQISVGGLTSYHPTLEFDAANAFGTPIRSKVACISGEVYLLDKN